MKFLMIVLVFAVAGCPSTAAVCIHLETQCAEDVAQVCDTQGRWEDVMDCSTVEPGEWSCGVEEDEHTCLGGTQ